MARVFRHGKNNTRNWHIVASEHKDGSARMATAICGYWSHGPQLVITDSQGADAAVCPKCKGAK